MFNHEKYRAIQEELLEFLKDEKDIDKGIEFYCKNRKLIFFKGLIFDDWNNNLALRVVDHRPHKIYAHLVEMPFEADFIRKHSKVETYK